MSDSLKAAEQAYGAVCAHGQLARSCNICELERERDEWKAKAEANEREVRKWKSRAFLMRDIAREWRERHSGAANDVLNERQRQISVEGWSARHDDNHDGGELATAAVVYAMNAASQLHPLSQIPLDELPLFWPWEAEAFKPKGARRDLVRAGALIIAEIERLDRAARSTEKEK